MLVNEANLVQDMLLERLREAHLESVLLPDKSQCLDMEDSVWLEMVLSDGSELERVEGIVAELKEIFRERGTRVDGIIRAVWDVVEGKSHGPAYGKDGSPRAAEEFYATLKSGNRVHSVVVEFTHGATFAVRHRLDGQAATGKADEKQVRDAVVALVRKFVEYELRQGGPGYWNPLKHPRRELNEPAVLFFSTRRD
jgi:hypothetical protein